MKRNKRNAEKHSGLKKNLFSKIKQEFHDIDYAHKLSEEDKAWLSKFMNEDLGANFTDKGDQIYTNEEDIKEAYRRNNQRNRDIYAQSRAQGKLDFTESTSDLFNEDEEPSYDPTEALIDRLDED